jgi:ApaG protein
MSVKSQPRIARVSHAATRGIRVTVRPRYLADESDPTTRRYIFAYRITIANETSPTAMLLSRRWWIVDSHGRGSEVIGDGVVGRTPRLAPGEMFEYESFCPLPTAWGTMEGSYTMRTDEGETFEVTVPRFYLVADQDGEA